MPLCNSTYPTPSAEFICNSERGHEGKHADKGCLGPEPYCVEWTDEEAALMRLLYP